MIVPPEKLTGKQQQQLESICQASSDLRTVYLLSQEFVTMLKERQVEVLDSWRVSRQRMPRDGTHQFCQRDSPGLRGCLWGLLLALESWGHGGTRQQAKISEAANVWTCSSGSVTGESSPRRVVFDLSCSLDTSHPSSLPRPSFSSCFFDSKQAVFPKS
jgi:hypothetical protein